MCCLKRLSSFLPLYIYLQLCFLAFIFASIQDCQNDNTPLKLTHGTAMTNFTKKGTIIVFSKDYHRSSPFILIFNCASQSSFLPLSKVSKTIVRLLNKQMELSQQNSQKGDNHCFCKRLSSLVPLYTYLQLCFPIFIFDSVKGC